MPAVKHPASLRAAITTLGCRLNQAETGLLADGLRRHGLEIVAWGDDADLIVVNSCAVTAAAEKKTRQTCAAARQRWPQAVIVLAGCVATLEENSPRGGRAVDLMVPNRLKTHVAAWLPQILGNRAGIANLNSARFVPASGNAGFTEDGVGDDRERTRINLKIQEGCDCFCSYCIVPFARGAPRSRQRDDVLREARVHVRNGCRELVLTGVNIGAYSDGGNDLVDLAQRLLELGDGFRLRFSSTEPGPVVPRAVRLMASTRRVCRFLHMPLQYGEDRLLQRMNRPYTVAHFADLATAAKATVPGLCLGSDLIVGFPGETPQQFDECCRFVEKMPLSYAHVFRFSPRKGTAAALLPDRVDGQTATGRHRLLTAIAREKACRFAAESVGTVLEVIVEGTSENKRAEGVSDNFLKVEIENLPADTPKNTQVAVRVHRATGARTVSGGALEIDAV